MASLQLGPVAFSSNDVGAANDGQLRRLKDGRETVSQEAITDDTDIGFAGITFNVAASGYNGTAIGLTSKSDLRNGHTCINFCVLLSSHGKAVQLTICESGVETFSSMCQNKDCVSIRLNGEGTAIQYVVNNEVLHTSTKLVPFPLVCKVCVTRESGNVWLLARDVQWSRDILKVVTLQVVEIEEKRVTVSCTNLSGEVLASITAEATQDIALLKQTLSEKVGVSIHQLRLVDTDGRLVVETGSLMAPDGMSINARPC